MKKYLLAPFLGALAMFIWGFVYYGISGIPYQALQPARDVGPALDKLFPTSGTYIIPDPRTEEPALSRQLEAGPFATVHITKGAMPAMDPVVMVSGFVLEFVSCLLLVILLGLTRIGGYPDRVIFVIVAGVLMAFFAHGGQAVWWHQDWNWQLRTIIHDVVAFGLAGAVIAGFIKSGK
ncbi:MAG: hypothetical protein R3F07_15645 [Opitutaceae bacterium]